MKKYRIINNIEGWLGNQSPTEENLTIDEAELKRLSQEWEKPIDELMEDLEEIEE